MEMKQFFIFAVDEIKKFKELFDYIKSYKYIEFFKAQIYLFFKPITQLFKSQKESRTSLGPTTLAQEKFEIVGSGWIDILREEVKVKKEIKEDSFNFSKTTKPLDREKNSMDEIMCTLQAGVEVLSLVGHNAALLDKMKVASLRL